MSFVFDHRQPSVLRGALPFGSAFPIVVAPDLNSHHFSRVALPG
jgi:hypothetical protein